ncbi:hypothetical protein FB451DRAFT_1407635 [Mycena latifolia]|nr:hypothetical protein FB451DRAFT_1407635 [Mycena latifolia]
MEDSSMLLEHTLVTSGDIADCGAVYFGWPAQSFRGHWEEKYAHTADDILHLRLVCPICQQFPQQHTVTPCGHVFCELCVYSRLGIAAWDVSCLHNTNDLAKFDEDIPFSTLLATVGRDILAPGASEAAQRVAPTVLLLGTVPEQ